VPIHHTATAPTRGRLSTELETLSPLPVTVTVLNASIPPRRPVCSGGVRRCELSSELGWSGAHGKPGTFMKGRHRRGSEHGSIPMQRSPHPLGITGARTHVHHTVTGEAMAAYRHAGRYPALCGARVLAAGPRD
jgi:hypothetical protein